MFLKVGHRGARAYEIENTLRSYKKAIESGANAVELDVWKSKDGELIGAALKLKARYLVPFYRLIHTKNIEDAHKNNLRVIVWTINTKQEAKQYRDKGVDGIASDKPDIL